VLYILSLLASLVFPFDSAGGAPFAVPVSCHAHVSTVQALDSAGGPPGLGGGQTDDGAGGAPFALTSCNGSVKKFDSAGGAPFSQQD